MGTERMTLEAAVARFGLIDAEFISCSCLPGNEVGELVVKFYPYWEHPTYLHAMESGKTWQVPGRDEGAQIVTVRAYGIQEILLRRRTRVQEWAAPSTHPALFRFEDHGEVICETEPDPRTLLRALRRRLRDEFDDQLLLTASGYGRDLTEPVSLGEFPRSLCVPLREELCALGVELSPARDLEARTLPSMLLIDHQDYVIAERFEVEVPQFRFHPSWVTMGV